jgi:hypothetical protein
MALEVWATQNAVDTTGSGTTDFAHGSITTTPVAALHCFSTGTANGTPVDGATLAFGISDGTLDQYVSMGIENGVTTSATYYRHGSSQGCVAGCLSDVDTLDGGMTHNSFIAGGQRLNNADAFATARLCNSLFFSCDNAKVISATLPATQDTPPTNVDPGFAWKVMIVIGIPRPAGGGSFTEAYIGFFDKTNQGSLMFNSVHNAATFVDDPGLQISNTRIGGELLMGTGATDYTVEAIVGSGTSVDLHARNNPGDSDPIYCLFLGWSSDETVKVVSWDSPTSNGSNQVTSVGFTPQACIHLLSFAPSYDTAVNNDDAGVIGVSFETANEQFCAALADEHNATTSNTQGLVDDESITVPYATGAAGYTATFTGYLSNGWDHNWTDQDGTTNKLISLAFEAGGENTDILVPMGPIR